MIYHLLAAAQYYDIAGTHHKVGLPPGEACAHPDADGLRGNAGADTDERCIYYIISLRI